MNYKAIDSHCHPQFPQYDTDRPEVIRRALDAGIGIVCVGTDEATSRSAVELSCQYEGLYCSVGLHPNDNLDEVYNQSVYEGLATAANTANTTNKAKIVAIGEIGLDYFRTTDDAKRIFQKERFLQQLALAKKLGKPVIIHCRDAHADMRELLTAHEGTRGVIHSFTGELADALHYIELGFHIGFSGIITFADYDAIVKRVPLERILLETDAPYLAPASKRGKRNEPVYILEVAEAISRIKGVSKEEVLTVTTANARALFSI